LIAEQFNDSSGRVEFKSGAKLGAAGSGVSGQPTDRSYVAELARTEIVDVAPVGLLKAPYAVQKLEELTITIWYKPGDQQVADASLLDAAGMYLISQKGDSWTARVGAADVPKGKQYWFNSGNKGTPVGWFQPNEWIFLALVWKKSANEVCFYQGTKSGAVKKAQCSVRDLAVGGLVDRPDRDKHPDAIGNTGNPKYNRPVNGSIDDVRIFSKALDDSALEKIRQADLKNEQPPGF
jgi:hypothetical protein